MTQPPIDIQFPAGTTINAVQRLLAGFHGPPGPRDVKLSSNAFMPAAVVSAILHIVRGLSDFVPSFTFFERDHVSLHHVFTNGGEAEVVIDSINSCQYRWNQAKALAECAAVFWPVRIICRGDGIENVLCAADDLSRVVHIDVTADLSKTAIFYVPSYAVVNNLVSLRHLRFAVIRGIYAPSLVNFVAAAVQRCVRLEQLTLDWQLSGDGAIQLGRAVRQRRTPLAIYVMMTALIADEGSHVPFLREVARSRHVSRLTICCLNHCDANACKILDVMQGSSVPLALKFHSDWTDVATLRRMCAALAANALRIISLRFSLDLSDIGDAGLDMERALVCNHTLKKFKIRMEGKPREICQWLMSGMAQNAFIDKFHATRMLCTPANASFARQMMTTRLRRGPTYHGTGLPCLLNIWCEAPWENSHLVCESMDGYAVQRAIDRAEKRDTPRFLARRCDLSHGLPLMRGEMADVKSVAFHWCQLTLT